MKRVAFSGAHDATALWVESGKVEVHTHRKENYRCIDARS